MLIPASASLVLLEETAKLVRILLFDRFVLKKTIIYEKSIFSSLVFGLEKEYL